MGQRLRRFILDPNGQVRENGDGPFILFSDLAATTDEPGLRDALYETAQEAHDALVALEDGHLDHFATPWTACPAPLCVRARAALALTSAASDGSLDVERLARALKPGHDFVHDGGLDDCQFADGDAAIEAATRIAAEYERLNQ